jgi:chromosome segregation ATPase
LVRDLDKVVKEVNLLGQHEEESSQKITDLEALCKRLREDAQRLREERTAWERMMTTMKGTLMSFLEWTG